MAKRKLPSPSILEIARERLGFASLRPGQAEAVRAILDGHDTLVVQPTGSGKSAIYQIAGLMIEGSTVIVSPLIALQKDQVDAIAGKNPADAVAVNSAAKVSELEERLARVGQREVEYVFLAPEQLRKPETIENLKRAKISFFVVDEAHCISEWGHDFRPDYLRLGGTIESLGHPRVLALTATATERVREEIMSRLRMQHPRVLIGGFDRPNIHLRVDHFRTEQEKRDALVHRTRWAQKPGIVYTATRKAAEQIMNALAAEQVGAVFYHGGMKAKDRHHAQDRFMAGEAEVIVATNAFGMGVDKADVRFVYHYDPSDSLDSYYQEIGRAGRDGEKAEAVLFYRGEDIGAQTFKTAGGRIEPKLLRRVGTPIVEEGAPIDPEELADDLGLSNRKLTSVLQQLEDAGATETLRDGRVRARKGVDLDEAAEAAVDQQERQRLAKRERLAKMQAYAETTNCRRELLLKYLGEEFEGPCNNCDRCESAAGAASADATIGLRREVV